MSYPDALLAFANSAGQNYTMARALVDSWALAHRIAALPGDSALMSLPVFEDDSDRDNPFAEELRALDAAGKLARALFVANVDGLAAVMLATSGTLSEPFAPGEEVASVEVFKRDQIIGYTGARGPLTFTAINGKTFPNVHPSRFVVIVPAPSLAIPSQPRSPIGLIWGELSRLYVTSNAAARAAWANGALLIEPPAPMPDNPIPLAPTEDEEQEEQDRINDAARMSGSDSFLARPGEKVSRLAAPATGFGDLEKGARAALAMATGIPASYLFSGDAAPSLGSAGEGEARVWSARLRQIRRDYFEPFYNMLGRALYAFTYKTPPRWAVAWAPSALDAEELTIRREAAAEAREWFKAGIATAEEVRAGFLVPNAPGRVVAAPQGAPSAPPPRADAEEGPPLEVPAAARDAARKVLRWREEHPNEIQGMTATGWTRARQLAEDERVSFADAVEIRAWFARHGAQPETRRIADPARPWTDAGRVAWDGWGGDAMRAAVDRHVEKVRALRADASPVTGWAGFPVDPSALAPFVEAARAAGIDFEEVDRPHLTLTFLGSVGAGAFEELRGKLATLAPKVAPGPLTPEGFEVFTGHGTGSASVVLLVKADPWLDTAERSTLRALARLVSADPAGETFRPHITIGTVSEPSAALLDAVRALPLPVVALPAPGLLEGRVGARVARFPLDRANVTR